VNVSSFVEVLPSLIRFFLMALFVGLFSLTIIQRPIMVLWARAVESDKPIFTLLFTGLAALAKAIQEIANILS
jgi:hypothetical protein